MLKNLVHGPGTCVDIEPRDKRTLKGVMKMLLNEMPEIRDILQSLRSELASFDRGGLIAQYHKTVELVTEWKYSVKGDCFDYLPYVGEVHNFPASSYKIVNRKYNSIDEACHSGKYCNGFIGDKLAVIIHPGELSDSITAKLLMYYPGMVVKCCFLDLFKIHGTVEWKSRLGSLSQYHCLADGSRVRVGLNVSGKDYSIRLYSYVEGRAVSVRGIGARQKTEEVSYFHYDALGNMCKVTQGSLDGFVSWSRPDKNISAKQLLETAGERLYQTLHAFLTQLQVDKPLWAVGLHCYEVCFPPMIGLGYEEDRASRLINEPPKGKNRAWKPEDSWFVDIDDDEAVSDAFYETLSAEDIELFRLCGQEISHTAGVKCLKKVAARLTDTASAFPFAVTDDFLVFTTDAD